MLDAHIKQIQDGTSLTASQMTEAMEAIMTDRVAHDELVTFLTALRNKGETVEEIVAAVRVMRHHATQCEGMPEGLVDTCGTGGDRKGTFNISTAAAFVIAGADVPVAKHGNRSVSSRAGSADVLEALGVAIDLPPEKVRTCIHEAGIGFFFARRYHPAMKHVAAARKEIGTRTIFNLLGPLANPAGAHRQLIGVFAESWCEPLARVLGELGSEHVMVVHGQDGMDEVTLANKTTVAELKDGSITTYEIDPRDYDMALCAPEDLEGGDVEHNAHLMRGLLEGYESPLRDVVMLNAAAALIVAGRAMSLEDGLEIAEKSLNQGHAMERLKKLIEVSQR